MKAELLRGRYEVLETVGRGGEGRVVKALDHQHERTVALKIRSVMDDSDRQALLGEARVLLALPPHPLLPLVREDFFEGDDYVIAMDWVEGTDLGELLAVRGHPGLAPLSVLAYLADAAEALTHLHSQSPAVIHGDVKPANLILTSGGRVKLVDFGMSSSPQGRWQRAGTPGFRAPELAVDAVPSRASDVFSLAATAIALFTGAPPSGSLPSWSGVDDRQAAQLEAALRMGLAIDPERRPASPGELVERMRAGWAEALPTGVITFCLSDIEGSTALWESRPEATARALVRHDELIADAVQAHSGQLLRSMGEGDSTVSVFHSAPQALAAAAAATTALAREPWPEGIVIRVRIGLHTGEAEKRGSDYFGPAVNLAARLRGQADGGQVFLSEVTAALVEPTLPDGYGLVDLGPHRLKGLAAPQRVFAFDGPGLSAPLPATECPYRGLLAFEPDDRDLFFGRDEVLGKLLDRLSPGRLVALVGSSGSGKSSLLRAGVIGAVRAGALAGARHAVLLTPGSHPRPYDGGDAETVCVVDQFEELFTLCDDREMRAAFVDSLLSATAHVVIGVRADFYGQLTAHAGLALAVESNQVLLGAMNDDELRRAITEPARLAGLRLETGLVDVMVRDVAGEPGALPLLSHALRETWERRDGRTLTVEAYEESGGVRSAVAQTADSFVATLPDEDRVLLRSMFLRLTELGDGVEDTRRRVEVDELVPDTTSRERVHEVLERLADARLVTLGESTAEVAHEVLIREWPTLRQWLDEDRESLRLHRRLGDAARLWDAGGRERSDLYRGTRLDAAREWTAANAWALNATERAFLEASVENADAERRDEMRRARRLRGLLVGTSVLLVVAVVVGALAVQAQRRARDEAARAEVTRLAADARRLASDQPDLAMLLAVAAFQEQDRPETRSALQAVLVEHPRLLGVLQGAPATLSSMEFSPDGRLVAAATRDSTIVWDAATFRTVAQLGPGTSEDLRFDADFAADGSVIVDTGPDGMVRQWSIEGGELIDELDLEDPGWELDVSPDGATTAVVYHPGADIFRAEVAIVALGRSSRVTERIDPPGEQVSDAVYAPDGSILIVQADGTVTRWGADGQGPLATFEAQRRTGTAGVVAAGSGGRVAVGWEDGSVVLYDQNGSVDGTPIVVGDSGVTALAFAPDGQSLATGDAEGQVAIWDLTVAPAQMRDSFGGESGRVNGVAFDHDGGRLSTANYDRSGSVWALDASRVLSRVVVDGAAPVIGLAASPDGEHAALGRGDGSIELVDVASGQVIERAETPSGGVLHTVAFAPDGGVLAGASDGGDLLVLDSRTLEPVGEALSIGEAIATSVAFSPDGRTLAAATFRARRQPDGGYAPDPGADGAVLRWRTDSWEPLAPLSAAGLGEVWGVAWSPDGQLLASAYSAGQVVLWDAETDARVGEPMETLDTQYYTVAFSPDSRSIATVGFSGVIRLWDTATQRQVGPALVGHREQAWGLAFTPDARLLVSTSNDGTLRLWDGSTGAAVGAAVPAGAREFPTAAMLPDGQHVLAPGEGGALLLISLAAADWQNVACRAAGRPLTDAERAQHLGDVEPPDCP